ncbi:MAG TPA: hypothetical protein VFN81_04695 [Sphingomicrobium sp.]|jgi:hypothetical protein|nr:hypothetical protein [Sphingomicrobium sp.]
MKNILAAPLLLALIAATPPTPTVQVATGDWSKLPALEHGDYNHLSSAIMSKIYEIGRQNRCKLPGQYANHIDLSISFAAQFGPDGKLARLLLPQLNCPEAESWLGGTLVQSIQHGDFRPGRNVNPEGWYRGDFSFYYEG